MNLSSRLEGANRAYGTWVLAGEATVDRAKDDFVFREVDRIRVKDRTAPARIFELVARKSDAAPRLEALAEYERALETFHQRDFQLAGEQFAKCASEYDDPVAAVYVARCRKLVANPPPEEWDGVFEG